MGVCKKYVTSVTCYKCYPRLSYGEGGGRSYMQLCTPRLVAIAVIIAASV